ncbi:MAG: ABC transporter ATP-binding protein [Desulfobacterales bacterium]|nr:ABC transporter ATP-binding protein [Desulfobacterales bacterium]
MAYFKITDLTKRFGGVLALEGVDMEVEKGQVYAIIGPNGAGKTTLFNCVSRVYSPDEGAILFKDKDLLKLRPHQIARQGIARTFQNIELFTNATVLDNIFLGRYMYKKSSVLSEAFFTPWVKDQELKARRKVEEIIDFLDLQAYRDERISSLSFGIQKIVELGRALALDPELLLLDEPSSGLNPEESQDLCFWIEDIKEDLGITIMLVEHDMRFVMQVSDAITALDFGRVIAQGHPREVQGDPEVIKAYLGEENGATP